MKLSKIVVVKLVNLMVTKKYVSSEKEAIKFVTKKFKVDFSGKNYMIIYKNFNQWKNRNKKKIATLLNET